jgi:hypothetical protein
VVPYHGIVFNPVAYDSRGRFPNAPGLQYSDGVSISQQLSDEQTSGVSGIHTVVLEMDADRNWSYSVDGAAPTTGTIGGDGFDLTRTYSFFVRNQKSSIGNNIQSVTLSTTVARPVPQITAFIPDTDPGKLSISWDSVTGKAYDILATTDLAGDAPTWTALASDIATTPPENTEVIPRPVDPVTAITVREKPLSPGAP